MGMSRADDRSKITNFFQKKIRIQIFSATFGFSIKNNLNEYKQSKSSALLPQQVEMNTITTIVHNSSKGQVDMNPIV